MSLTYFPTVFWFEVLSLAISIAVINRLRASFLIYIVPMLAITVICEGIGTYYKFVLREQNGWIYNIVTLVQVSFWLFLFRQLIEGQLVKRVSVTLIAAFLLFSIVNLVVIQGPYAFNNYTLIAGSAIIIFQSCLYLFQYQASGKDVVVLKDPTFYLASGPLFFFAGTFVYFSLYHYSPALLSASNSRLFGMILINLNIIYYVFISIGLLFTNKTR